MFALGGLVMSKRYPKNSLLKRCIRVYFTFGIMTVSIPFTALAENSINTNEEVEFDSSFFDENSQHIDLSAFSRGTPVLAGDYSLDVYVNSQWLGKKLIHFSKNDESKNATTCFNQEQMLLYGVKKELLDQQNLAAGHSDCLKIEQWVEHAFYNFDQSKLRLDISIPQIALQHNANGYIDPSLWDRGINAGFLSYGGSVYKNFNNRADSENSTNAFMSLNAGINLAGWQLRHQGHLQWQEKDDNGKQSTEYTSNNTYLQRAFSQLNGIVTLGDSNTNGELFDSFGYRGLDISSDDRMLPNSQSGYAPRIRGNAKTNAKVEIHQQGQLIYQTTVAPGAFEINDLNPSGYGGNLIVSVIEASGEIQKTEVPYSSVVQMLRPGMNRYSFMAGKFHERDIDYDPWIVQAKYQRGINNYLSGFSAIQASDDYISMLLGGAFATPLGSVALDITHSQADFKHLGKQTGQSYRLSYSKLIHPTNTNLTLAAYRYSTENFYNLRDAVSIRDAENKGYSDFSYDKHRSEFQITLNQKLPENYGSFYLVGSWVDYWNRQESNKNYQVGYNNSYHGLTYSLSANKRQVQYRDQSSSDDTEYMLSLSFPLEFRKRSIHVNTSTTQNSQNIGFTGFANDRFNYGASMSHQDYNDPSFNANARYQTNFATLGGSYSFSDNYQQGSLSASGSIVAHKGGIHFGPQQGQTMVLVHAPDAAGAKVNNTTGLRLNKAGYAVIPYVTPYRLNNITLDPQGMTSRVELNETSHRIAPYAGAISRVNFGTSTGYAIFLESQRTDGKNLPFGATVYDSEQNIVGVVAQGSTIYIRTEKLQNNLSVQWGEDASEQCQIHYDVSQQAQNKDLDMFSTEAICK